MLSLFQVFKMVFGIIASVLVLFILLTYSGGYGENQKTLEKALIMKNFRSAVDDVYLTGNPTAFDLSKFEEPPYFDSKMQPAFMKFGNNAMDFVNPLFFRYGDTVSVTRSELDFGWWKFGFVEAAPQMTVVFNPVENSESSWSLIRNITSLLPDWSEDGTAFKYAFCGSPNGYSVTDGMDKFNFQRIINLDSAGASFDACVAQMGSSSVLVTVSGACSEYSTADVCANPDGVLYIGGKGLKFMDSADIVAAIIGGTQGGINGVAGENLYLYKQRIFRSSMRLAAEIMSQRARTLSSAISSYVQDGRIEQGSDPFACIALYNGLANSLDLLSSLLENENYYETSGASIQNELSISASAYRQLSLRGCEI